MEKDQEKSYDHIWSHFPITEKVPLFIRSAWKTYSAEDVLLTSRVQDCTCIFETW